MKIRSRTILLAFLALLLSACAATKKLEPVEIQIQTAPPGALVDWNGNVLGIARAIAVNEKDERATRYRKNGVKGCDTWAILSIKSESKSRASFHG